MTQFETPEPYMDDYSYEPPRRSGLAVTALVLSILGIVPCCGWVTAPIGLLLGIIGVAIIGSRPHLKGRGMAWAAVFVGLIVCVLWATFFSWAHENFTRPQSEGPRTAFAAGFAADPIGFREEFFGDAATASDEDIEAFITQLRNRYGDFVTMERDEVAFRANPPTLDDMMRPIQEFPYRVEFADATVSATIESAAADPEAGEFYWQTKFGRIVIHDPDLGDIEFPPGQP